MRFILLIIPFLFLGCASDDDSPTIDNNTTGQSASFVLNETKYVGLFFTTLGKTNFTFDITENRDNNEITGYSLSGFLNPEGSNNEIGSNFIEMQVDTNELKAGAMFTNINASLLIDEYGSFGSIRVHNNVPSFNGMLKITKVNSDGSLNGEYNLENLHNLDYGESVNPKTINVINGTFKNIPIK